MDWQIPDLEKRLGALSREKCALFASGCVMHAIAKMPEWVHEQAVTRKRNSREAIQQLLSFLDRLLTWIVRHDGDPIAELTRLCEECLPDPACMFKGEIDLFVVVRRSWECVAADSDNEDRVWPASQAALESYAVVGTWHMHGKGFRGRAQRIEGRKHDPTCIAERRFQSALLDHVETMVIAPDLTYAGLLAAVP